MHAATTGTEQLLWNNRQYNWHFQHFQSVSRFLWLTRTTATLQTRLQQSITRPLFNINHWIVDTHSSMAPEIVSNIRSRIERVAERCGETLPERVRRSWQRPADTDRHVWRGDALSTGILWRGCYNKSRKIPVLKSQCCLLVRKKDRFNARGGFHTPDDLVITIQAYKSEINLMKMGHDMWIASNAIVGILIENYILIF